jgi:enoyl-CoA hydratase
MLALTATSKGTFVDASRYSALEVITKKKVTTITINRPQARNAINEQLHEEIARIWPEIDADPETNVIVFQGSGGSFCAGGDLKWLLASAGDPEKVINIIRDDQLINERMLSVEKPIICKVDGPAIGLGCSLALYCDFVFATQRSVFADPHVSVGLVAGDGGALLWPQLIGYARARRYLLTGDHLPAQEAADFGLITQCVADAEELDSVADAMVDRMLHGAQHAIRLTKASINASLKQMSVAVTDRAAAFEGLTMMTEDHRIALEAFAAKQPPVFSGN